MRRLGRSGMVAAFGLLAACGGSAGAPASSPSAPASSSGPEPLEPAEPRTIEEARAMIARAEASLHGAEAKDLPKTESTADEKPGASRSDARALGDTASCRTPCQALRSMRRAVTALCRMTGEGDDRCADARRTLATNEQRVAPCACPP